MSETWGYNDSYSECKARKIRTMSLKGINDLLAKKDAKIDKLERDNEVLKKALKYYANECSWEWMEDKLVKEHIAIRPDDMSDIDNLRMFGGKRARQALSKIRSEGNE